MNAATAALSALVTLAGSASLYPARAESADSVTRVQALKTACESDNAALRSYCVGYFVGMVFAEQYLQRMTKAPKLYCNPIGGSIEQYIAVFVSWANRNPQRWHEPHILGVQRSLQDAFPCRAR